MYQRSTVMMTMLEIDRLKVIQTVDSGDLRSSVAAERLGMSARQVRRLVVGCCRFHGHRIAVGHGRKNLLIKSPQNGGIPGAPVCRLSMVTQWVVFKDNGFNCGRH